jgi:TolB-like protein/class 3 adenylate cyclase
MAEERVQRRLAAILFVDAVASSRLMEKDEASALSALKHALSKVIEPQIAHRHGRVLKYMGDGVLAMFDSVVDAVDAAVAIQRDLSAGARTDESALRYRIGINLGDVVVQGDDILGDAVGLAARLQSLAEPGGIAVSQAVQSHVRGKVAAVFVPIGEQRLKNIAEPIRVFRVDLDAALGSTAPSLPEPARVRELKPSVAVLPFTNMSGDPDQQYFSDGITEDIITELARFRSLFVIARNSSFAYRGQAVDVRRIGRELGVRFVVEGSFRRAGERLRITAQLIEAATGNHVWAERYDRAIGDLFAVQDELTRTIVATLAGQLEEASTRQAKRKLPETMAAYELLLRGLEHFHRHTPEDEQQARALFEKAIAVEPGYALAHVNLARIFLHQSFWDDSGNALAKASEHARAALLLDHSESWCHLILGFVCLHRQQFEEAESLCRKAVRLNPNDADIAAKVGLVLTDLGKAVEAIEFIETARRLDPHKSDRYSDYLGLAYYTARRYEDAVREFKTALDPKFWDHAWMAAAYAQMGAQEQAAAHARATLELAPDFTIGRYRRAEPFRRGEDIEHWVEGFRLAGLPD